MGIINATPDSFSDGGDLLDPKAAVAAGRTMIQQGADILDIGGESTRPGSNGVSLPVELGRVVPIFDGLAKASGVALSIDTTKAAVARACLERGAVMVNDVSAGRTEPAIFDAARDFGAYLVLMHMKGTPRTMQDNPDYADVVREVCEFLKERAAAAEARGVARDRIIVDPGIGFGKTLEHNLALLRAVPELKRLGYPLMVGASRKSLFKALFGHDRPKDRDAPTASLTAALAAAGVDIVRVHEIPGNLAAARVGDTLRSTKA
jgi:dihydropteroate synthase